MIIVIPKNEIVDALKIALNKKPTTTEIRLFSLEYVARNRYDFLKKQATLFASVYATDTTAKVKALLSEDEPRLRTEIIAKAITQGIKKQTVDQILRTFLREGTLYEPRKGYLRIT